MTLILEGAFNAALLNDEIAAAGIAADVQAREGEVIIRLNNAADEQAVRDIAADHDAAALTVAEQVQAASTSIRALRGKARPHAEDIRALLVAVIEADAAMDTVDERFQRIRLAVQQANPALRDRFKAALRSEELLDVDVIGLSNLTPVQKAAINAFAGRFANRLGTLLAIQ